MDGTLGLIGLAVAAFASTNVDDLVLLGLFFSSRTSRAGQVVAGQYLGIGALVGLSLIIASVATLVPAGWIHWLGVLPIAIGRRWLVTLVLSRSSRDATPLQGIVEASRAESSGSIVSVALVTFANGGDNLGVYTPMFVASSLPQALVIIA